MPRAMLEERRIRMKKTRVWPALLAALVILAGCAAAPPEESDPPTEEFVFTRENMPRLNGSTSAVPLAEVGLGWVLPALAGVLLGAVLSLQRESKEVR